MRVCVDSSAPRMEILNHSIRDTSAAFDGVIVPANPGRIYLELWGVPTLGGAVIQYTFGEAWSATKPSYTLSPGQKMVFDKFIPMGDVYAHTDINMPIGAFEGVPYEEN